MGYTLEDAYEEEGYDRLVASILEDNRGEIIERFVEERLAAYYVQNPTLHAEAAAVLAEGKAVLGVSPSAAIVFARSCVELVIRDLLLKPVIHGLVHDEDMGSLLTDLISLRGQRTEGRLFAILGIAGLPDLKAVKRPQKAVTVWEEHATLIKNRNSVVHEGKLVESDVAREALALAEYMLHKLYPQVRAYFVKRYD